MLTVRRVEAGLGTNPARPGPQGLRAASACPIPRRRSRAAAMRRCSICSLVRVITDSASHPMAPGYILPGKVLLVNCGGL